MDSVGTTTTTNARTTTMTDRNSSTSFQLAQAIDSAAETLAASCNFLSPNPCEAKRHLGDARRVLEAVGFAALLDVAEAAHLAACVHCVPSGACGESLKPGKGTTQGQLVATAIPLQCPKGRLRLAVDRLNDLLPQGEPE